jgi:hypothetical protein
LNQREGVVLVEPECISDIVPVVIWVNFFKSAPVWLLKYFGIVGSGFVPPSSFDFSSNDVEDAHATLQRQPEQYHLRMAECVRQTNGEGPMRALLAFPREYSNDVPADGLDVS